MSQFTWFTSITTITGENKMASHVKSRTRLPLTPDAAVRIAREMLGLSQNDLAKRCRIPQSTISGIETGKISIGVERAAKLARALHVHPAVLLFPDWDVEKESAKITAA